MGQAYNTPIGEALFNELTHWIRYQFNPEDIFGKIALEEWAEDNGYVKQNIDNQPTEK